MAFFSEVSPSWSHVFVSSMLVLVAWAFLSQGASSFAATRIRHSNIETGQAESVDSRSGVHFSRLVNYFPGEGHFPTCCANPCLWNEQTGNSHGRSSNNPRRSVSSVDSLEFSVVASVLFLTMSPWLLLWECAPSGAGSGHYVQPDTNTSTEDLLTKHKETEARPTSRNWTVNSVKAISLTQQKLTKASDLKLFTTRSRVVQDGDFVPQAPRLFEQLNFFKQKRNVLMFLSAADGFNSALCEVSEWHLVRTHFAELQVIHQKYCQFLAVWRRYWTPCSKRRKHQVLNIWSILNDECLPVALWFLFLRFYTVEIPTAANSMRNVILKPCVSHCTKRVSKSRFCHVRTDLCHDMSTYDRFCGRRVQEEMRWTPWMLRNFCSTNQLERKLEAKFILKLWSLMATRCRIVRHHPSQCHAGFESVQWGTVALSMGRL